MKDGTLLLSFANGEMSTLVGNDGVVEGQAMAAARQPVDHLLALRELVDHLLALRRLG